MRYVILYFNDFLSKSKVKSLETLVPVDVKSLVDQTGIYLSLSKYLGGTAAVPYIYER